MKHLLTNTTKLLCVVLLIGGLTVVAEAQIATPPSAGNGTRGNPYQIATLENLYWIAASSTRWSAHYIQTADIDAGATKNWSGGSGWSPIGNTTTYFTGSYKGKGYKIDSLYINRSATNFQGLFGIINGASIDSLRVENVDIIGKDFVGGLVGYNEINDTVSNSYSTGKVSGTGSVGGLVGFNDGNSRISNSYSTSSVSGSGNYVGGLVGMNSTNSTISNSYSTGSVSGTSYVGGLVGYNVLNSNINKSYSTGSVSGNNNVGGLVGWNNATVTNSFWDTQTSGRSTSAGGTGKSTAEMKTQSTFLDAGWSPSIWYMDAGINNGYPYLSWQNPSGTPLPIQLASFTASVINGSNVLLEWTTISEVNNYGFYVERRAEDEQVFTELPNSFVAGAGTTLEEQHYSWTDENVSNGTYYYRLRQVDLDGSVSYSYEIQVIVSGMLDAGSKVELPKEFALEQNYPNPFNPVTVISYQLPVDSWVTLKIYDIIGKEVEALVNEFQAAGFKSVSFDGSNLPSGVYVYRLTAGRFSDVKKLLLLK